MKSPKDMKIIQIDVTNACVNRCSNCTRFCGHHTKPFFMDFETFKRAVDSLEGYEGCVGIIGGEPTIHPEIEKFIDYIKEKRIGKSVCVSREPISNMLNHIFSNLCNIKAKIGLWSSLNRGYYRHFETINDAFEWQLLNDHDNKCQHQAILMARKDLNISDEEFYKKRDKCFIQNTWSATITPKGAFFCEVAGALDMLFNGPGGWEVTNDWWKRGVDEFGDQLHWCELCSLAIDVPKRISDENIDDVSETLLKKLIEIDSPKIKQGKYCLHTLEEYLKHKDEYKAFEKENDYMDAGENIRTTTKNRNYYPRTFDIATIENVKNVIDKKTDWVVISSNKKDGKKVAKTLKNFVINPGCLYIYKNELIFNVLARSIRDNVRDENFDFANIKSFYPEDKIIDITGIRYVAPFVQKLSCRVRKIFKLLKIRKYFW